MLQGPMFINAIYFSMIIYLTAIFSNLMKMHIKLFYLLIFDFEFDVHVLPMICTYYTV